MWGCKLWLAGVVRRCITTPSRNKYVFMLQRVNRSNIFLQHDNLLHNRKGAGKSSFVAALVRMPDADGDIMVDGVQIKEINLQEARQCISAFLAKVLSFSGDH